MAEINVKLQDEIAEWQKRMQEYLVEVHMQQQQQASGSGGQDSNPQPQVVSQNGAQSSNDEHQNNEEVIEAEQPRASSQLRE